MCEPIIPGGYILLSRKIIDSQIWSKPPLYLKVWIYLLSKAQHSEYKSLKRGQLRINIPEIQKACSSKIGYRLETPTYKQIRDIIDWLRKPYDGNTEGSMEGSMIGTMKGTHGMIVNIEKYAYYQNANNYEGQAEGHGEGIMTDERRTRQGHNINKNDNKNDTRMNKNIFSSDSIEYRLSSYLFKWMQKNNFKAREPNFQTWSKSFDKILRIDKRDLEEVKEVIKWCQTDSFWCTNILSPDKLRKQYDTLLMQMKNKNNNQKQDNNSEPPTNSWAGAKHF